MFVFFALAFKHNIPHTCLTAIGSAYDADAAGRYLGVIDVIGMVLPAEPRSIADAVNTGLAVELILRFEGTT